MRRTGEQPTQVAAADAGALAGARAAATGDVRWPSRCRAPKVCLTRSAMAAGGAFSAGPSDPAELLVDRDAKAPGPGPVGACAGRDLGHVSRLEIGLGRAVDRAQARTRQPRSISSWFRRDDAPSLSVSIESAAPELVRPDLRPRRTAASAPRRRQSKEGRPRGSPPRARLGVDRAATTGAALRRTTSGSVVAAA